ncbi:unnamed protein product [Rotaria sp. Silwood1]|nr:unnamed protein product [Rotaria sp. Silwood1]
MRISFKLDDFEKQLINIQTLIVELEAWYSHIKLCHVYFGLIKIKTQTTSSGFDKILTQNFKKQIIKKLDDDMHETCHVFVKYGIDYVSVAKLKYPMLLLNE